MASKSHFEPFIHFGAILAAYSNSNVVFNTKLTLDALHSGLLLKIKRRPAGPSREQALLLNSECEGVLLKGNTAARRAVLFAVLITKINNLQQNLRPSGFSFDTICNNRQLYCLDKTA